MTKEIKNVVFKTLPWGDGSSIEDCTNILCDEWQVVIAEDMPIHVAEEIVLRWNDYNKRFSNGKLH